MIDEVWKPIPGYEGRYEVSDTGRVRRSVSMQRGRLPAGGLINPPKNYKGYLTLTLTSEDGKSKSYFVHQLVMLTFMGECPAGMEINHLNEDKTDNRLANLQYLSHLDNVKYSRDRYMAARPRGTDHHGAKLTESEVRQIRQMHANGMSSKEIANELNHPYQRVYLVVSGKLWKHIPQESAQ